MPINLSKQAFYKFRDLLIFFFLDLSLKFRSRVFHLVVNMIFSSSVRRLFLFLALILLELPQFPTNVATARVLATRKNMLPIPWLN
jgi:hypothetical protein